MSGMWSLFPYPTLSDGRFSDGSLLDVHPACATCPTRECAADRKADIAVAKWCRFGVTYLRVDEQRLLLGVLAAEDQGAPKRAKRRLRQEPERRVRVELLQRAVSAAREAGPGAVQDFDRLKAEALKRLHRDPALHAAVANELKRDFDENLNQSHDFRQLVYQVRGYAEALLRNKFPELTNEEAAERLPVEGAIYFANEMLLIKMDALRFIREVNLAFGAPSRFQIHPFILKYVRIYRWQAEQKDLDLRMEGSCYAFSRYNNEAIGAVIQALLDNLVKYAPAGSRASINFREEEDAVLVTFSSLGPKIDDDEFDKIFLPGCRGRAASSIEGTGQGVGLAAARQVSDALALNLRVEQSAEEDAKYRSRFWTSFHLTLRRAS